RAEPRRAIRALGTQRHSGADAAQLRGAGPGARFRLPHDRHADGQPHRRDGGGRGARPLARAFRRRRLMRLLQAMGGAQHGGAEAFFERLAVALQHAGVEQQILVRGEERAQRLAAAGVATERLAFGGMLDIVSPWRFRVIVRRFAPQVVLTWMTRATPLFPPGGFVPVAPPRGYYDLSFF